MANLENIVYRKLGISETIQGFDCGDKDLNEFLTTDAASYYKARLSTSYVLEDSVEGTVLGYFSLAHDKISISDFASNSAFNRFRKRLFANGKMLRSYPAVKICRLATDRNHRCGGIGTLIVNMIVSSYLTDNKAGCRFITVDAYSEAMPFYTGLGFTPLSKTDASSVTRLLYFDLKQQG